ncbi:MAG: hypothetical protein ABIH46_02345 [Chloroflexota bacterium]
MPLPQIVLPPVDPGTLLLVIVLGALLGAAGTTVSYLGMKAAEALGPQLPGPPVGR